MELAKIQQEIRNQKLDGWLFFDHHLRDPLAYRVLGFTRAAHADAALVLPDPGRGRAARAGAPHRARHDRSAARREDRVFQLAGAGGGTAEDHRRAEARRHAVFAELRDPVCLDGGRAGPSNWCAASGWRWSAPAELIQAFEARWTPDALESHLEAGRRVDRVRAGAFAFVRERRRGTARRSTEMDVKRFVRDGFAKAGLVTDHGPIVGVNANASNPHYEPTEENHAPIHHGRPRAARSLGEARPARAGVLRHHVDALPRARIRRTRCGTCSRW